MTIANEDFFEQIDLHIGVSISPIGNAISAVGRVNDKIRLEFHWENRLTSYRILIGELEKFIIRMGESQVDNGTKAYAKYCHFYIYTNDEMLQTIINKMTIKVEGTEILVSHGKPLCPLNVSLNLILSAINEENLSINKAIDFEKIVKDLAETNIEENSVILPSVKSLMLSLGELSYGEEAGNLPIVFNSHSMKNYCQVLEGIQESLGRIYEK